MNEPFVERRFGKDARVTQRERESRRADEEVERSREEEEAKKLTLEEERASTDSHRHLGLPAVAFLILLAALLEVFAAEPGAEALGFGPLLTYVITAIFVIAVAGGAIMLAHASGERWRFLLGFQVFVLAVLFALRFRYLTAFESPFDALLAAAGLTLLTCVIYLVTEELARRAEPFDLWNARRAARKAERERRRTEGKAAHARAELQKAMDARAVTREVRR
jgi:antitoxin component of RelBE/YafQ-DinJ toxin-antitoxin module